MLSCVRTVQEYQLFPKILSEVDPISTFDLLFYEFSLSFSLHSTDRCSITWSFYNILDLEDGKNPEVLKKISRPERDKRTL